MLIFKGENRGADEVPSGISIQKRLIQTGILPRTVDYLPKNFGMTRALLSAMIHVKEKYKENKFAVKFLR